MAKEQQQLPTSITFKQICYFLLALSSFSTISFFLWSRYSYQCNSESFQADRHHLPSIINLLSFPQAWNHLRFSGDPPAKLLKIAVFIKKWPRRDQAGGMERHAMTLHLGLAKRGHELHIFTTSDPPNLSSSFPTYPFPKLKFHLSEPTAAGYLDQARAWALFQTQNSTGKPFDVVHSESVALLHTRARHITPMAASWHGIAYETIDSDITQELLRPPALTARAAKVVDEVRFFHRYAHHITTGDVLRRVYISPPPESTSSSTTSTRTSSGPTAGEGMPSGASSKAGLGYGRQHGRAAGEGVVEGGGVQGGGGWERCD